MPLTITCPSCRTELDLDEQHRGWTVRCPDCRHEFVAKVAAPRPAAVPELPPRSPEATANDCNAAGIGLTVVGVLQLCTCAFVVFFNAAIRPNLAQPINPVPEDEEAETIFAVVVGALGLFQSAMMILGAVALRRRRRFSLAMAGAVLALLPNLCCIVTVPFGVWGVVLLGRPDVRAAFAANREPLDPY
jgi:DNA-directed RNA polymerase subunit RPC12/RpoP